MTSSTASKGTDIGPLIVQKVMNVMVIGLGDSKANGSIFTCDPTLPKTLFSTFSVMSV
jgi:hypothetical protein